MRGSLGPHAMTLFKMTQFPITLFTLAACAPSPEDPDRLAALERRVAAVEEENRALRAAPVTAAAQEPTSPEEDDARIRGL